MYCFQTNTTPVNISLIFFPPHILAFVVWALKIKAPCSVQRHTASCGKNPSLYTSKRVLPRNYHDLYNCLLLHERKKRMVFYPSPIPCESNFSSPQRKVTKFSSQFICHVNMRYFRPCIWKYVRKTTGDFFWENHTSWIFPLGHQIFRSMSYRDFLVWDERAICIFWLKMCNPVPNFQKNSCFVSWHTSREKNL